MTWIPGQDEATKMSAEWWKAEADRYCKLHIAAHQQLVACEAKTRELGRALAEIAADDKPSRSAFELVMIARGALTRFLPE